MEDVRTVIAEKLAGIERDYQVNILYACESGSRAWGFASPDSDYDVRFIYAHQRNFYLTVENKRDVIELPVNEVLDIAGWDIRKTLGLMRKTNAVPFEWLQSPIIYKADKEFYEMMLQEMAEFYAPRPAFHHYFSMARNCFENELQGDTVKLKKYFYALRPVLAARWIIDKDGVPPMEFDKLLQLADDYELKREIVALVERKKMALETEFIPAIARLNNFIEENLNYCINKKEGLREYLVDTEKVNKLFRSIIGVSET